MLSTSFRFKAKLRGPDGEFPYPLCSSPMINIPHHRGTFITTDEPALTHRVPQSPQFTLGLLVVVSTLWVLTMTRVHLHSITQSSFTALKILHSTVHLSFPTDPRQLRPNPA